MTVGVIVVTMVIVMSWSNIGISDSSGHGDCRINSNIKVIMA